MRTSQPFLYTLEDRANKMPIHAEFRRTTFRVCVCVSGSASSKVETGITECEKDGVDGCILPAFFPCSFHILFDKAVAFD